MNFYIGTSGYQYRQWNDGAFYPPSVKGPEQLSYLLSVLNTVEINASFYSIPKPEVVERWGSLVPHGAKLVLKAPRSVTHRRRLRLESEDPEVKPGIDLLEYFIEGILKIPEATRGPIFLQVPASMRVDREGLIDILNLLSHYNLRTAIEVRHESWFRKDIFDTLEKYQASMVTADWSKFKAPLVITSNFIYVRRHGPSGDYQGFYTDEQLENDVESILSIKDPQVKDAYVFFNNDGMAAAPKNAKTMIERVAQIEDRQRHRS